MLEKPPLTVRRPHDTSVVSLLEREGDQFFTATEN